MGLTSLSLLITFLIGGCSTYKIDETSSYPITSEYRPTSRNSKSLFGSDNSREISELRDRLDRLEAEFQRRFQMSSEESAGLRMMDEGAKMMEEVRVNFTTTFSNITNIYSKIKVLRAANALKCSKKKCDNIRTKVKKINQDVKFLADLNITSLNIVLHNISSYTDTVSSLETSVTSLTDTTSSQQTAIDTTTTKVNTLETTVNTIQPIVTSNTEKITKVNNCFADINSADCPSARLRRGKAIDDDVDEVDYDVGPDPSAILRDIFRINPVDGIKSRSRKNKKTKRGPGRQGTTPLVPQLKIVLACMADNTDSACTAQYSAAASIPAQLGSVSSLTGDMTTVKACLTDPSSSACTGAYSAASTLPASVASVTSDLNPIKACLTDPSASGCTGTYSAASTLPASLTSATSDLTPIKACLTDPTATGCTGTYSGTSSMPGITATVSTLSTDVTALKGCMTDPTASACTGTYSAATTLNKLVESMSSCMTNPTATACTTAYSASTTLPKVLTAKCDTTTCTTLTSDMTIVKACLTDPSASGCSTTYSAASTLPGIVTNVDKCMTSVSDSTCTASYGASSNLITSGGSGLVGYIQQLNKPSILSCVLVADVEDYAATSASGCTPQLGNYAPLTWTCTQTPQQDTSKNDYFMAADAATGATKVTINIPGYYKIELSALMTLNKFQHRVEVFKKVSGTTCDKDSVILALNARDLLTTSAITSKERSSNAEGFFNLAAADELIVVASTSGGNTVTTNPNTGVTGDSDITKTSWIITRINY